MTSRDFSDFTAIFFWDFKRMDNVNYNFKIVKALFNLRNHHSPELNKPIILLLAAIIECILYDFVRRVTEHRRELIPGIDESVIDDTRNKICDQFEPLIAHVRKHNLLESTKENGLYETLDYIRKLRNRIHIQNRQQQLDKDEANIWTDEDVQKASSSLEKVCEVLCNSYPRPSRELIPMTDFPRPWT
jgi:hypothetical protein